MVKFNFGKNWQAYSKKVLDFDKLEMATIDLKELIGIENIKDRSFLDIGSGSGIHSIAAQQIGASKVIGFDISNESVDTARQNARTFEIKSSKLSFIQHSILDDNYSKFGKFDIVYSWGVLHHTGDMWKAIENAMNLINDNGTFAIAIYNKHWSSPLWRIIKYIYNVSPKLIKKIMIFIFYWIILVAKFLVTFKNPFKKRRGMDFYYDVIDWVGGYPYEYACKKEIVTFFKENGFKLIKYIKPQVPTGCNEFIFKKV